ncbi:MAG TPA: hypothetical protein VK498_12770 [Ferruginibacter sp.]|nr:hypothetical protein [Ferruginibacter sp.]
MKIDIDYVNAPSHYDGYIQVHVVSGNQQPQGILLQVSTAMET